MTRLTMYATLTAATITLCALARPARAQDTHADRPQTRIADGGSRVDQRELNQRHRIASGVHDGGLTRGETRHLEHREEHINQRVTTGRRRHDGKLTPGEKRGIARAQDRTSRAIYRDRHNAKVRKDPARPRHER